MERIPHNSLDSMEGVPVRKEIPLTFEADSEEKVEVKKAKYDPLAEAQKLRLEALHLEMQPKPPAEIEKEIGILKKDLDRACHRYFQESRSLFDAECSKDIIYARHMALLDAGMPHRELLAYEDTLVEKYSGGTGVLKIKYANIFARIKDAVVSRVNDFMLKDVDRDDWARQKHIREFPIGTKSREKSK